MGFLVLLIDDDETLMDLYQHGLQVSGFKVQPWKTADGAIEKAIAMQPNVIVLDIMMEPGQSYSLEETQDGLRTGVLLMRDLQAALPQIPVVILTNVLAPKLKDQFHGVKVYLKPHCSAFTLAGELEKLLADSNLGAATRPAGGV